MNRIVLVIGMILVIVLVAIFFVGCAKVTDTTTEVVKATVESTEYHSAWMQPVFTGKTTTLIPHPARYNVTIVYDGMYQTFNLEDLYYEYENNWGAEIEVNLVTQYYDNGSTKRYITLIEE